MLAGRPRDLRETNTLLEQQLEAGQITPPHTNIWAPAPSCNRVSGDRIPAPSRTAPGRIKNVEQTWHYQAVQAPCLPCQTQRGSCSSAESSCLSVLRQKHLLPARAGHLFAPRLETLFPPPLCNPMINSCAVPGSCCAAFKPFPSAPLTGVGWKGPGNLHGGVGRWFAPPGPRLRDAGRLPKSRRVLWVPG